MDQRSIRRNGLWMRVGCSRGQAGKPAAAKFGGNHRRAAARTPRKPASDQAASAT